ncbi:MAG: flavodoxin-dependent (E)-4-hydroxy-3-methylbut-2-enyl-diphosphate synthase [Clostridiales bacterium]|nr:flavodoxin-dependent (E)-4-hydroxy-3-methylbut-2-enyl-diphosphate synthase [Clostridiales bacterium]
MTRQVFCGNVPIGGGAPVSIQSMTNTDTRDAAATLVQISRLADAGCQIVRCAVPDMEAAKSIAAIKKGSPIPVVADIHFDYKLAIAALDSGADKVRINPGNIGGEENFAKVLSKAKECDAAVRIGVNSGSLEKKLLAKYGGICAEALCESALKSVKFAESEGFESIVVSLKSSDVKVNHEAHRLFAAQSDRPLHIGLTEAGAGRMAEIKSCAALGALLLEGIGDTMRISLTGDPVREVKLAAELLQAVGLRRRGIDFISCPSCGRTRVDLDGIAREVENRLEPLSEKLANDGIFIKVAVMGCEVNGPGEAKDADFGVACGKGCGLLFKRGETLRTVPEDRIVTELIDLIEKEFYL